MSRESEFAKRHPVVILVYVLACMIWTMVVRHPAAIVVSFVGASVCYVALAGIIRWLQLWIPAGMMLVFAAVILLILLVQLFQTVGTKLAVKCDKRLKKC